MAMISGRIEGYYIMDISIEISEEEFIILGNLVNFFDEKGEIDKSIALCKFGAKTGDITFILMLANLLSQPPHFLNVDLAKKLYMKCCAAGYSTACHNLAILYNNLGNSKMSQKYMRLYQSREDVFLRNSETD